MLRPADTSPEAWEVYLARLRAASPAEKLQMLSDWYEFTRACQIAGLRKVHPFATEPELAYKFLENVERRKEMD